ncbi:alpha/beta hydrolase [Photobacterium atrarenae]|uniref:Lysophospholipase n=1 Tax=Photobacterium atrarenae TaxID=865757 RepID=A0ABY5GI53_9GAMM|nr:alpha/beta fold hydrolase [Photobacterium atrarenae]UTV28815.1 lysophospholipase [Photobacterium atrarenae]
MPLRKFWILITSIGLVISLSGCESLFFWPTKKMAPTPEMFDFTKRDRFFRTEDGTIIHGWQIQTQAPHQGTIFFLHGNAQNLSYHAANVYWLAEQGWEVVMIDYRGYGRSVGRPDFSSVQQDALASYRALQAGQAVNRPVIVWGQSLGASIAINMVAELPPAERPQGLIIDSTFSSHQKIMQQTLGKSWLTWLFQYPLSWTVTNHYAPANTIASIEQVPILITHSTRDPLIDESHAQTLFELANGPKQLWLSERPGHITIWQDETWREKLFCQLNSWPELKPLDQACPEVPAASDLYALRPQSASGSD